MESRDTVGTVVLKDCRIPL